MKKTRYPSQFLAVLLLLLGLAVQAAASPVPPLVSERNDVWDAAWETAWEIAWESPADLTVEFSGDMEGAEGLEFTVEFHDPAALGQSFGQPSGQSSGQSSDQAADTSLDISWGAPQDHEAQPEHGLVASFGLPWVQEDAYREQVRLGKLYVETTPADASVRVLNADSQFRQGMDLSAGQYVIEVASDGYEPQVRRVEIIEGMAATVRMDLVQVADAGQDLAQGSYLPPDPSAATAEQLAKDLATPGDAVAAKAPAAAAASEVQSASHSAAHEAQEASRPANLGLLQLAQADTSVSPGRKLPQQAVATGSLRVNTIPADARVRILDIMPKFEQGMSLEPGVYTIDAQLYGYGTVERTVTVEPGRETVVDLTLEELPEGRLYVKTVPEGAFVRILDIRPRFNQGMNLAEGTYTIDATISGYETVEKQVEIRGGQDTVVEVELEQVAPTGRLYVDTLPADAEIRVLGILPVFHQGIELAEGTYTIDAKVEGSERVEMQVEITAGKDNRYTMALNDTAEPGRLYVETRPAGAAVRVLDIAPRFQQGIALEPGTYSIDVSDAGFETKVQTISVLPGRETRVAVTLQPRRSGPEMAESVDQSWDEPLLPAAEATAEQTPEPKVAKVAEAAPVETGIAAGDMSMDSFTSVEQELDISPAAYEKSDAILLDADEKAVKNLDVEIFLSMANLACNAGDYLGAIDSANQVLALDAGNLEAQILRSKAYMGLGQYGDALRILDAALARHPGNEELRTIRQKVFENRETRTEQEAANSTAISLDPRYYEVRGN